MKTAEDKPIFLSLQHVMYRFSLWTIAIEYFDTKNPHKKLFVVRVVIQIFGNLFTGEKHDKTHFDSFLDASSVAIHFKYRALDFSNLIRH